ncbi:MAG: hypothetical protein IAC58_03680 [Firmicutes bacterium]|uniref:Uncharacterized protein n=1 Tax=Candidatus Onthovivens merdipullorum TaxID=2840889 RepID=A0A9D9DMA2_9BACL|nr:hypothetical protein [Candidatus Onthovivens merdipullorum]
MKEENNKMYKKYFDDLSEYLNSIFIYIPCNNLEPTKIAELYEFLFIYLSNHKFNLRKIEKIIYLFLLNNLNIDNKILINIYHNKLNYSIHRIKVITLLNRKEIKSLINPEVSLESNKIAFNISFNDIELPKNEYKKNYLTLKISLSIIFALIIAIFLFLIGFELSFILGDKTLAPLIPFSNDLTLKLRENNNPLFNDNSLLKMYDEENLKENDITYELSVQNYDEVIYIDFVDINGTIKEIERGQLVEKSFYTGYLTYNESNYLYNFTYHNKDNDYVINFQMFNKDFSYYTSFNVVKLYN